MRQVAVVLLLMLRRLGSNRKSIECVIELLVDHGTLVQVCKELSILKDTFKKNTNLMAII